MNQYNKENKSPTIKKNECSVLYNILMIRIIQLHAQALCTCFMGKKRNENCGGMKRISEICERGYTRMTLLFFVAKRSSSRYLMWTLAISS